MKTLKNISMVVLLVMLQMTANAQSAGTNQIGIRLGGLSGIDFRHVSNNDVGIHLNLGGFYPFGRVVLEGMAEKNFPIKPGNGFVFYVGGGAFIATDYVRSYRDYPFYRDRVYYLRPIPGLTATAGIDYYFKEIPINIGLDIRPRFSFLGLYPWDGAISARYIF